MFHEEGTQYRYIVIEQLLFKVLETQQIRLSAHCSLLLSMSSREKAEKGCALETIWTISLLFLGKGELDGIKVDSNTTTQ